MPIEILPEGSEIWTEPSSKAGIKSLVLDPFWKTRTGQTSPSFAIMIRSGTGFIERSTDGGTTWTDVTPGNPADDYSQTPTPTAANMDFDMLSASEIDQGTFTGIANFEDGSNNWGAWLVVTDDDFDTASYYPLGESTLSSCSGTPEVGQPYDQMQAHERHAAFPNHNNLFAQTDRMICEISTDKYVFGVKIYETGETHLCCFSIDWSTKTVTWGDYLDPNWQNGFIYTGITVAKVDTDKFIFYANRNYPAYAICTVVGLTITQTHELAPMCTTEERANWTSTKQGSAWQFMVDGSDIYVFSSGSTPDTDPDMHYRILHGTIEGDNTVTWDTIAGPAYGPWDSNDVRDWKIILNHDVDQYVSDDGIGIADFGGGVWLGAFLTRPDYANGWAPIVHNIVAGNGLTFGSPATLTTYDRVPAVDPDLIVPSFSFVEVNSDHAALLYWERSASNDNDGYLQIMVSTFDKVGTTASLKDTEVLHDYGDIYYAPDGAYPAKGHIAKSSSGNFIAVNGRYQDCRSVVYGSVGVTGVITINKSCKHFAEFKNTYYDPVWVVGHEPEWILMEGLPKDFGPHTAYVYTTDQIVNDCQTPSDYAKAYGISMGKGTGTTAWATICNDTTLKLLDVGLGGTINARHSLGAATIAQADAKTWIAWPFVVDGQEDYVRIFGRMNDPQSLGNPSHIIYTNNGGSSFALVEGDWTTEHCGSVYERSSGALFAIRNVTGGCYLYKGTAAGGIVYMSISTLDAGVDPQGMILDLTDGTVIACSNGAQTNMVALSPANYLYWGDITANHNTNRGVNAVVVIN